MELGLKGRVAVVTGGAAGIGAAIARTLANEGCCVWVADLDGMQAERTASALSIGSAMHAVALDVSSRPKSTLPLNALSRRRVAWTFSSAMRVY